MKSSGKALLGIVLVILLAAVGWQVYERLQGKPAAMANRAVKPIPVEVSAVQQGVMELRRTFSGTLEAQGQFTVAPKVSGRIERLYVNLADTVRRGQIVAELDNAEYEQAVAQAEADLAVARANLSATQSALEIANRELTRIERLLDKGITTDTQFDVAKANQLTRQAELRVAEAELEKAQSIIKTSKIQLAYTRVTADWSGGQDQRRVAERLVDEGSTVAANASLLRIVDINPLMAVIHVTEKDYANMRVGQAATLVTDAVPGEEFIAHIARIAPVFRESTRQARVELNVDNPEDKLRPGMFIRATVVLRRIDNTRYVPELAVTRREGQDGLFILDEGGNSVRWQSVQLGITEGDKVEILNADVVGNVVILGQQFLDDGAAITVVK